ncbi:MAG TPA: hypothetical protein VLS86_04875 [Acidimicrobiia bacterium]|nr:hypothetical protein [Acidimicrobiia bacterium]
MAAASVVPVDPSEELPGMVVVGSGVVVGKFGIVAWLVAGPGEVVVGEEGGGPSLVGCLKVVVVVRSVVVDPRVVLLVVVGTVVVVVVVVVVVSFPTTLNAVWAHPAPTWQALIV